MKNFAELKIFQRLADHQKIRVLAFGASNTQRYMPGMHWFDYVELGFKNTYGGESGQFINSGISGNTTVDLLRRFDSDLALFQPHAVILTIGGNDCNPDKNISPALFRTNLQQIYRQISALGAETIFQTYYACDLPQMPPRRAELMVQNMQIVREVAEESSGFLVDNFARWETLRRQNEQLYRLLMLNSMHVNALGNMVIGLDLMRHFNLQLKTEYKTNLAGGLFAQAVLDEVNS